MVVEDMLGDYNNRSSYGGFNESNCYYSTQEDQNSIKKIKTNGEINLMKKIL